MLNETKTENPTPLTLTTKYARLTESDDPKFKIKRLNAASLSDVELISVVMNCHVECARDLMSIVGDINELGKKDRQELEGVPGIGSSKVSALIAALELGRRRAMRLPNSKNQIRSSQDIAEYIRVKVRDLNYEIFGVIFLNRANKITSEEIISMGGITGTVADPRIIFRKAVMNCSTSIILYHNHPSGNLKPSRADEEITQKIKSAGQLLDIKVLDHMIVSDEGYYSFMDEGVL